MGDVTRERSEAEGQCVECGERKSLLINAFYAAAEWATHAILRCRDRRVVGHTADKATSTPDSEQIGAILDPSASASLGFEPCLAYHAVLLGRVGDHGVDRLVEHDTHNREAE